MASKCLSGCCLLGILFGIVCPTSAVRLGEQQQTLLRVCEKGSFLSEHGECLRCNCLGKADYCEDITGVCINCRVPSTGDFCELCQEGYSLAVGLNGQLNCEPCACPLSSPSNNFAVRCESRGATLRCICQEGYAGHYCERCAPGYYGNPMEIGDSCKKCDCNGNSDPNLIFSECHNVTGHCQHCWGNTAGTNCERCAPGYYGDAIDSKNCRECKCNKCGTSSCDDRTGVCHCKPGVTGPLCDHCEEGYSGFSSCQGCRRCECGPASLRPTCHPLTHSCLCRPGAGGRYCERCLPGYWDYSPSGCQKCDCKSGYCDMQTGECLTEATINMCNNSCDECIWQLIRDLKLSNKTLDELKVTVLNISTGAAANDRLKYYNYTAHQLQAQRALQSQIPSPMHTLSHTDGSSTPCKTQFQAWRKKSSALKAKPVELEKSADSTELNIRELEDSEIVLKNVGQELDNSSLQTFTRAQQLSTNLSDLNHLIEEMIHDWEVYSVQQDIDPEEKRRNFELVQQMLSWMRQLDVSQQLPVAKNESTEAHDLLRRIHQLEKKLKTTGSRLSPIKELMSRFSIRLKEAQDFLLRAATTLEESKNKHRASIIQLHRKKAKQQRFAKDTLDVNITLETSRVFLIETQQTAADLEALVQNVTEYHAAIDGASQRLVEKTEQLMLADRDLVQRADEHAQNMERDANMLEEDLKESDANGFVQKAISAVNVYNNIVKYIEDANITSRTTLNLAQRAEDAITGINAQLDYLVTQSDNVFKKSVSLFSEKMEVEKEATDKINYIEETREIMDKNAKKLKEIEQDISEIHTDKTRRRLDFTSQVADRTLNRSAEVLQTVTPIHNKVEEWDSNMRKNKYSVTAYEQAVDSAGKAVERLNALVPELLNRLKVVENKKPVNNVTTNIVRIRELIAQARSVAKKVQVSMKFDGQSSVELHRHSNLEDLKTVTSISLFMRVDPDKDPIEDRFVLYLGDRNGSKDYMGLAIKSDNLVFIYKLGGEEVEISLTSKPVSQWPAVFNYIKVERLGRHGKLFLTIPSQSSSDEQKFIQKGEAPGKESLFDTDPKGTVFFVGKVPPDVTLPPLLSLAPFVGCIELASLNNDVISLYNFKKIHPTNNLPPPCPRYKLAFSQSRIASYLFDGTGYALVNDIERKGKFGTVTRFDIAVRTVANNGVIFLMVNGDKFFLLEMKNGFLRLMYDFGFSTGPKLLENNLPKFQINDARYHEMSVIYHQSKKVILLLDKNHVKTMENPKTTLPFSDIYIGGAPSSILKARPELSSVVGLRGCVKGFQFLKKDFNLLEEPGTIGISSGCPEESFTSRNAYFTGSGYLGSTAKISPFDSFEGGMSFRTLQPSGLLFYHTEESSEFSISVENGAVVLNCKGTKVKSHKKQYNDGRTHFLMASVNKQVYSLVVDDKDKRENKRPSSASKSPVDSAMKTFYFGGSPSSSFKNFSGCISYTYISREDQDIEAEDFQKYTERVQTSLQDCPVVSPPAAHLFRHRNATSGSKQTQKVTRDESSLISDLRGNEQEQSEPNVEPCFLSSSPRALQDAFHYGTTANSRQHYTNVPNSLSKRFNFSVSLKTQLSFGLIFYISDSREDNFISLFLSHGKIVYTFNVADQRVKISGKGRLDDGAWHHINVTRDGNLGRLTVDGLPTLEDRAHRRNEPWQISRPLFIGGVIPGLTLKNIPRNSALSFTGCLKNLQLNDRKLSTPAEMFGVTPCFQGLSEPGAYFSEEGGYVVLDKSHQLGLKFELVMELRPRVASAVLLHARSSEQFFTLYIHEGAVVVVVKDGPHEFFTKVSLRHGVCDGTWHRITVIRDVGILQLNVDSEVSHVVGQVKSSSADPGMLVFIGGFPNHFPTDKNATRKSFVGCMKNLTINDSPVSLSKAVLVSGAVSVGTCPAA